MENLNKFYNRRRYYKVKFKESDLTIKELMKIKDKVMFDLENKTFKYTVNIRRNR